MVEKELNKEKEFEDSLYERLKGIIDEVYTPPQPLMEKPKDLSGMLHCIAKGDNIHTSMSGRDPTYWFYPSEEIEGKVEDNKFYDIWYTWKDASDPYDTTTWNHIHYIQEYTPIKALVSKVLDRLYNL